MWIEMRSAASGADLPNSTNGVLKSLNVHRNSTSTSTWLTGRSDGRVMRADLLPQPGAVDRGGLVQLAAGCSAARP